MWLAEVQQLVSRFVDPDNVDRDLCEVIGVAELNGHLYVLQNKSKSIYVSLADKPYCMLSCVPLDGVVEPTDLAASAADSCLYVTDVGDSCCLWRVHVEERVAESSLNQVELRAVENASNFKSMSAESPSAEMESVQGTDGGDDGNVKQLNSTDASAADDAASAAEIMSEQNADEQNETQPTSVTQDQATNLQEGSIEDSDQCKQAGVDLQEFIRMISGCQASAVNVTAAVRHNKSELSAASQAELMKDEDAGETIRSLLERTGLMKKISEHGNTGPCMFEISRHYDVKRYSHNADVIFFAFEIVNHYKMARQSSLALLVVLAVTGDVMSINEITGLVTSALTVVLAPDLKEEQHVNSGKPTM